MGGGKMGVIINGYVTVRLNGERIEGVALGG